MPYINLYLYLRINYVPTIWINSKRSIIQAVVLILQRKFLQMLLMKLEFMRLQLNIAITCEISFHLAEIQYS